VRADRLEDEPVQRPHVRMALARELVVELVDQDALADGTDKGVPDWIA
jgi:hypothetical protein